MLVAYRLVAAGGALIHSAGVTGGEGAFLLLGRSGAGKTTASRLCLARGAAVLSDDLNAVRLDGAGAPGFSSSHSPAISAIAAAARDASAARRAAAGPGAARQGGARRPCVRCRRRRRSPACVAAAPYVNRDPWRREALLAVLERLARVGPRLRADLRLAGDPWAILSSLF